MTSKAYSAVTDRIIEVIEQNNELPWRRPWRKSRSMIAGKNTITKKRYRGINAFTTALFTDLMHFDSNEWVSFNQAKSLGGSVRKGEKGIPIVFFSMIEDKKSNQDPRKIPFARYSAVFNLAQCEGIEYQSLTTDHGPAFEHQPIAKAESMVADFKGKPTIGHKIDCEAWYSRITDTINLPPLGEFFEPEAYYCTLFHELIHSTGHEDRLNRKSLAEGHAFGSHEYSKEELIAELGACFLSSDAGIFSATLLNSAKYLKGWLAALKANPTWLVQSATAAQKAVDYLTGTDKAAASNAEPCEV